MFGDKSARRKRAIETLTFVLIGLVGVALIALVLYWHMSKNKFLPYTNEKFGFSMKYPGDWTVDENQGTAAVIFLAPIETTLDVFKENVNIVVQNSEDMPQNLKDYSQLAIRQITAVFKKDIQILESKEALFSGQFGYKLSYLIKGGEMQGDIKVLHFWTLKEKSAYQFTYTAMSSQYNKYLKKAEAMVRSFRLK